MPETRPEDQDGLALFNAELAATPAGQRDELVARSLEAPCGGAPYGQLSRGKADALYELELQELPRIGTSPIQSQVQLVQRVEGIALELAEIRAARIVAADPYWWRTSDLLDDVMDVLDAVRGPGPLPAV